MEYKFNLTDKIKDFIEDATVSEIGIGCSNSQILKVEKEGKIYFLKMATLGSLTIEYKKFNWLAGKIKVPEITLYEIENNIEYLITKTLPGEMLCSNYYLKNDNWKLGIPIVVEAFTEIYTVDIKDCPFNVALDYKLALVKDNIENNRERLNINTQILERFKTPENIYNYLLENRFEEDLCFSHGDISLPNIFVKDNKFSGFIDVGECGIADKWFDIAIAVKTINRNYGEEAVDLFFDKLGIYRNQTKIDYYLLLMELYL